MKALCLWYERASITMNKTQTRERLEPRAVSTVAWHSRPGNQPPSRSSPCTSSSKWFSIKWRARPWMWYLFLSPCFCPRTRTGSAPALTWCALGKGWDKGRKECPWQAHSEGWNVGKWAQKGATFRPLCLGSSLTHSFAQPWFAFGMEDTPHEPQSFTSLDQPRLWWLSLTHLAIRPAFSGCQTPEWPTVGLWVSAFH